MKKNAWESKDEKWIIYYLLTNSTSRIDDQFDLFRHNKLIIIDDNDANIEKFNDILSHIENAQENKLDVKSDLLIKDIKKILLDGRDNINNSLKINPIEYTYPNKKILLPGNF